MDDLLYYRNGKIIVCFQEWHGSNIEFKFNEFFITKFSEDVYLFVNMYYQMLEDKHIDFNIFCFENYEEAFMYLNDLKEGF